MVYCTSKQFDAIFTSIYQQGVCTEDLAQRLGGGFREKLGRSLTTSRIIMMMMDGGQGASPGDGEEARPLFSSCFP